MKHFEERTFEEIAAALGASPNTIKSRYYRGMLELRRILESGGERG
jgi:DNA-directed RNA polymerase specialized sigma24 family protein